MVSYLYRWAVCIVSIVYLSGDSCCVTYSCDFYLANCGIYTFQTERRKYIISFLFFDNPIEEDRVHDCHQWRGVAILRVSGTWGVLGKRLQNPPQIVSLSVEVSALSFQGKNVLFSAKR